MQPQQPFRVAFLTCASDRVNRQVVDDLSAQAVQSVSVLCSALEVELAAGGVVAATEQLKAALEEVASPEPDLVILHYAGWTEDQVVLEIVNSFQCPLMLWVTRDVVLEGVSQMVAHVGYMEATSCLKKMGKAFVRWYGGPDTESDAQLRAFILAAKALAQMHHLRFGWIGDGYGSGGILDTTFDEALIEQALGVSFVRIGLDEFFERYRNISLAKGPAATEVFESLGLDAGRIRKELCSDQQAAYDSLRVVLALHQLVAEHSLGALSVRCFPEFRANNVPAPCLAVSALNEAGTPSSCEGDVLSGVSMYLLSRLSGQPATIADVFSCDQQQNTMQLFHCGSAAPSLASSPSRLTYRTHCKPGNHRAGATVEFSVRPGEVSFLKLETLGERCRLFSHFGQAIEPQHQFRGTQAIVKTVRPVKELIEALLDHGVSHHMVLALGNIDRQAQYFSQLANVDLVLL